MKKILVPCDFSKPATNAFRFALDVASQSNGTVHLLNVVELPVIHDPLIMPVMVFEQDFLKELKEKVTTAFKKINIKYNVKAAKVKSHVEFGSPARMISEFAARHSFDLVIMGSHGTSGIKGYFIGSNAEKIVRSAPVPVLITKSYYKGAIKNIVFPNTLETENQDRLIIKVKALQAFFKATLHVVYVNTPANFTSDDITRERLKEFAKRFDLRKYTLNVYNYPFAENGILHFTKQIKGNMIAMGTHGRKGLSHFLNGSLAEDVANHADLPLWTYVAR